MKRRLFLGAGIAGLSSSILTSCNFSTTSQAGESTKNQGTIVHQVYFWLKEGITSEEEKDFLEFFKILKTVPGIKTFTVGKPASTNPRPVVDNSFSYSITVTFANLADINVYETHSIHTEAVAAYSKYWTKVEVKDSEIIEF